MIERFHLRWEQGFLFEWERCRFLLKIQIIKISEWIFHLSRGLYRLGVGIIVDTALKYGMVEFKVFVKLLAACKRRDANNSSFTPKIALEESIVGGFEGNTKTDTKEG